MKHQTKIKRRPFAFRVSAESSSGNYRHFNIEIFRDKRFASDGGNFDDLLSLRWQADQSDFSKWYGLRAMTDASAFDGEPREHFSACAKMLARIMGDNRELSPRATLERLAELKIARVEYDGRLSRYVTSEEAPPAKLRRFIDDYHCQADTHGATVSALATCEEHAREELSREWGAWISGNPGYAERFAKWIAAGKPVILCSMDRAAEFEPVATLLNEPATQPEAPAVAA